MFYAAYTAFPNTSDHIINGHNYQTIAICHRDRRIASAAELQQLRKRGGPVWLAGCCVQPLILTVFFVCCCDLKFSELTKRRKTIELFVPISPRAASSTHARTRAKRRFIASRLAWLFVIIMELSQNGVQACAFTSVCVRNVRCSLAQQ